MTWRSLCRVLIIGLVLSLGPGSRKPVAADTNVDLQLVLAIDTSGSIDMADFQLQLAGIGAAFRDADVVTAI